MTDESRPADELTASWHGSYLARWGNETPLYEAVTGAVSTVTGDARSAVAPRYDRAHAFALSQLFGGADGGVDAIYRSGQVRSLRVCRLGSQRRAALGKPR